MKIISTNDGKHAAQFIANGGNERRIIVYVMQLNPEGLWEFWYTIGEYSSMKSAKRYAAKSLAKHNYTLNV